MAATWTETAVTLEGIAIGKGKVCASGGPFDAFVVGVDVRAAVGCR